MIKKRRKRKNRTIKLLDGSRFALPSGCDNEFGHHCPACGSSAYIGIKASRHIELQPSGVEGFGDYEWSAESGASCDAAGCGWSGVVSDLIDVDVDAARHYRGEHGRV